MLGLFGPPQNINCGISVENVLLPMLSFILIGLWVKVFIAFGFPCIPVID